MLGTAPREGRRRVLDEVRIEGIQLEGFGHAHSLAARLSRVREREDMTLLQLAIAVA